MCKGHGLAYDIDKLLTALLLDYQDPAFVRKTSFAILREGGKEIFLNEWTKTMRKTSWDLELKKKLILLVFAWLNWNQ